MKARPFAWLLNEVTTPKNTDANGVNGYNWYFRKSEDGKPHAVLGIRHDKDVKAGTIEATQTSLSPT